MGHLKWFGAILILIAATSVGWLFSRQFKERPRHIRLFIDALTILEAEMLYSQLSLQDAFTLISKRIQEPLRCFFKRLSVEILTKDQDFVNLWREHLKRLMKRTSLMDEDYEILQQFGQTLGQHDYVQQEKNIRLTITYLQRQREEAIEQSKRYSKLANVLGVLLGLLLVLLLI